MFRNDTILASYNRLVDWLQVKDQGNSVTDIVLDYLNRGQRRILGERDWDPLIKIQSLTLVSNVVTLPSDCDKPIEIYADADGDGHADDFYYQEGREDNGGRFASSFTNALGHTTTFTFFATPTSAPVLKYRRRLDDFTGTGDYSFFPADILLRAAQLEHLEEAGPDFQAEFQTIQGAYQRLLSKLTFELVDMGVDMRNEVKDNNGRRVEVESSALDGGGGYSSSRAKERSFLP